MKTGKPAVGDLYATPFGREVEVLAVKSVDMAGVVDTATPVGTTDVIAYRLVGGFTVHLTSVPEVQDWVKIPGV